MSPQGCPCYNLHAIRAVCMQKARQIGQYLEVAFICTFFGNKKQQKFVIATKNSRQWSRNNQCHSNILSSQ